MAALVNELSKGYFVPLPSVILAFISRIRIILMRVGRDIIIRLGLLRRQSYDGIQHRLLQPFLEIDG